MGSSNGTTVTASAPPIPAREGSDGAAQQVDVDVVGARHRAAGHRVEPGARLGDLAQLGQPRPEPAQGAELGDRRELLVGGRDPELDQAEAVLGRDAGGLERPQHLGPAGQHPARAPGRRRRPARAPSSRRRPRRERPPAAAEAREGLEVGVLGVRGGAEVAVRVQRSQGHQRLGMGEGRALQHHRRRGRDARRPGPRRRSAGATSSATSHRLVAPFSRSATAASLSPDGRACPDVPRAVPRRPAAGDQVVAGRRVPSGVIAMPSYVVRVSVAHTSSSGSSSASRPALRSTAAAAFSQSARDQSSSEEAESRRTRTVALVGSSVGVRRVGRANRWDLCRHGRDLRRARRVRRARRLAVGPSAWRRRGS